MAAIVCLGGARWPVKLIVTVCDKGNSDGGDCLKIWIKQFSGLGGRFRMANAILD